MCKLELLRYRICKRYKPCNHIKLVQWQSVPGTAGY